MRTVEEIDMGDRVMDRVTGLNGIATARCEYMNGCVQIEITPPCKEDGELVSSHWVDIGQVSVVEANPLNLSPGESGAPDWPDDDTQQPTPTPISVGRVGGPQNKPPGMNHP